MSVERVAVLVILIGVAVIVGIVAVTLGALFVSGFVDGFTSELGQ